MGHPGPRWGAHDPDSAALAEASNASDGPPLAEAPVEASPIEARREKPPRVRPEDATIWRRLAAWLIDEVVRTLFYAVLLIMLAMFAGYVPEPVAPGELNAGAIIPQIVLRAGLSWIFWSQGTSPGAMLLQLRLVDAHGNPPGPTRGGIRAMVEIVSIMTMLLGFAWALFSRRRQTWHDLASGVYVINAPGRDRSEREG